MHRVEGVEKEKIGAVPTGLGLFLTRTRHCRAGLSRAVASPLVSSGLQRVAHGLERRS